MAYVSNAWKQTQRTKPQNDSPVSAGMGKLPSQTVTNKSELKALGERMGWNVRPLTEKEIRGSMSAQEAIWHELMNSENYKAAFTVEQNKAANEKNQAALGVRKKWLKQTPVTDDEKKQMADVATQFLRLYPQFIDSKANVDAVWDYMQENNLDPSQLSSPIEAFESLAQAGKVNLNPSAISAGPESSISGRELLSHRSFHLLLQRQRRATAEEAQSADQFKASHPELRDTRVPFLIAVRQERDANTAAHEKKTEAATVSSGSTNVIDYPQERRGVPPQPDKVSFRKKINSMTADEIQRECAINPSFRKSLDEME